MGMMSGQDQIAEKLAQEEAIAKTLTTEEKEAIQQRRASFKPEPGPCRAWPSLPGPPGRAGPSPGQPQKMISMIRISKLLLENDFLTCLNNGVP